MISVLIRSVMQECRLKQQELADLLGVPIQRVKRLSGGEAKKLTREECDALVRKLNIRAEWLLSGEGPMFQSTEEVEFSRRLDLVKEGAQKAVEIGLDAKRGEKLRDILYYAQTGDADGLMRSIPVLTAQEENLLSRYRASPASLQEAALRMLDAQGCEKAGSRAKSKA